MDMDFLEGLGIGKDTAQTILNEKNKEISGIMLDNSLEKELNKRGAKNISAALKLFDKEGLCYENGGVEGLSDRMDSFIKDNGFLFDDEAPKAIFSAPVSAGGAEEISREEFEKMGYRKRLKLFTEQPELYKKFTQDAL